MRILITGATGFVGCHLVEALAGPGSPREAGGSDGDIRALVRPTSDLRYLRDLPIERIEGDLTDQTVLGNAAAGVDVVLHLAALTRAPGEAAFLNANAEGTRLLLEAAVAGGCERFVYVSSLAAAGPAIEGRPVEVTDDARPITAYGRSKLAGEVACRAFERDLEIVVLRPPAVYGPRDTDLFTFFKLANWGVLPVPTGPTRPLQMVHVADLVRAIHLAGGPEGKPGLFHIAEAESYAWGEVLTLMARAVGRTGRQVPVPQSLLKFAGTLNGAVGRMVGRPQIFDRDKVRELLAPGWLCETAAASRRLGFSAEIPLSEGLRHTAAWYQKEGWLR
jgi:nucleoside-diphosphate-sugar epimerase